ncbi:MAG: ABC transporter substrate-binding protein [Pseudomonadota bacterium]|nr:ABC transporter substrate-binding protein [Pseudomonadota bacterium]
MPLALLLALAVGCGGTSEAPTPAAPTPAAPTAPAATPTPVRIGWQTTWATQGQLVAVLMHTDILAQNGFVGDFKGFPYGGPLNEGALAGEVDVLFTADQPALSLAAKAPSWGIVGRLMYNRVGTFVPLDSAVQAPKDLRGKRLAVPFGAAAQREALGAIEGAGLDPKADVKVVNLGLEEILGVVRAGATAGKWGEIDAAAAWDPTFAELEVGGQARAIASSTVTSVVVMNDTFVTAHAGADQRFMTAMAMAYEVYRQDPSRADGWFQAETKRTFEPGVLSTAATVEPNLAPGAALRVHLTDADLAGLTAAGAFMEKAGLLKAPLDVSAVVRPSAKAPPPAGDPTAVAIRP